MTRWLRARAVRLLSLPCTCHPQRALPTLVVTAVAALALTVVAISTAGVAHAAAHASV